MNPASILFNTAGPHAEKTADLFWYFAAVNGVVWITVLTVFFYSLWKRRAQTNEQVLIKISTETERRAIKFVASAVGATILILTCFVVMSYAVDRSLIEIDQGEPELEIEVTGHQWWWELRYLDSQPSNIFTTANEIHVPVGATVRFKLKSVDVIHSLWFPNVSGKKDVIPGRDGDLIIRADRKGTWLGKCAEFCGLQHAYMDLNLIVEDRESFEAWKENQIRPSITPMTEEQIRGQQVFKDSACILCHAIRTSDSPAQSHVAPDLTHLKSRSTIGAGAAPNNKGYLGAWILDPHGIKPGVHMPVVLQEPKDFQALLVYLETLK